MFWGFVIGLLIALVNHNDGDPYGIILIELNPLLRLMLAFPQTRRFMFSGLQIPFDGMGPNPTISLNLYIGCVISFLLYGLAVDLIRRKIKAIKRRRTENNFTTNDILALVLAIIFDCISFKIFFPLTANSK